MCGILAIVSGLDAPLGPGAAAAAPPEAADWAPALLRRGPDGLGAAHFTAGGASLALHGSLLQLRGAAPSAAPLVRGGDALLFAGQVFGGLAVPRGANDAALLLDALRAPGADAVDVFSRLRGPWAAVFWHAASATLTFGRDVFGRRSLLLKPPSAGGDARLVLASVAPPAGGEGYEELPPGLYTLRLGAGAGARPEPVPWRDAALRALAAFERAPAPAGPPPGGGAAATDAAVLAALRAAVGARCAGIERCDRQPGDAPVVVLFSGGVDSALLAVLADEALPAGEAIDLASVCFDPGGASPDRAAALDALAELRAARPGRRWRLVLVDAALADVRRGSPRLAAALATGNGATVMDLNVGAALWLAASAAGRLDDGGAPFTSAARVALLGTGADELFCGYARHRTAAGRSGGAALAAEVALDVRRLWRRNMGRDDRLVADWGREARHPFLDEAVAGAALAAPLAHLADFGLPPGRGDKAVLRRCLAALGLPRAAAREKRAIQFGSRLAAATNRAAHGSNRAANRRGGGAERLGGGGGGGGDGEGPAAAWWRAAVAGADGGG